MRILVVDDHRETRELITRHFARAGHMVQTASSCAEAARVLGAMSFDVVVLDVMLPDGSGIDLCGSLRAQGCAVPVLLLTARGGVHDRVGGLDAGADDYLVKPFSLAELVARVRALGRRGPVLRDQTIVIGSVVVDLERRSVSVGGRSVPLTAKEVAIVEVLAMRRGVVPREVLMESVWGDTTEASRATLDVLIGRIRRKLDGSGAALRTVRGLGYALESVE
jgi:DNA-binding response OmpR family regulator